MRAFLLMLALLASPAYGAPTASVSSAVLGGITTTTINVLVAGVTNLGANPKIQVYTRTPPTTGSYGSATEAVLDAAGNAVVTVESLTADTLYEYRVDLTDDVGTTTGTTANFLSGQFKTAPSTHQPFKVIWGTCWGLGTEPGSPVAGSAAFKTLWADWTPGEYLFAFWGGDLVYYDQYTYNLNCTDEAGTDCSYTPDAHDVADFRNAYLDTTDTPTDGIEGLWSRSHGSAFYPDSLQHIFSNIPGEYTWSDHEFGGQGGDWDQGCADPGTPGGSYVNGRQVFIEQFMGANRQVPDATTDCDASNGGDQAYTTWTIGDAQFWLFDMRSFRDAEGSDTTLLGDGTTAINAWTATLDQLGWFTASIAASTARFKVILSPEAFSREGYSHGSDNWEDFPTERAAVLAAIKAASGLKVVLSGDWHTNAMYWADDTAGRSVVLEALAGRAGQGHDTVNPTTAPGTYIWKENSEGIGWGWPSGTAQQQGIGVLEIGNRGMTIKILGFDGTWSPSVRIGPPEVAVNRVGLGTGW